METTSVSVDDEILFSFKKKEILSFATTWINLEDIYVNHNKPETKRQIPPNLTYMWTFQKLNS